MINRFLSVDPSIQSGHTGYVCFARLDDRWLAFECGTLKYPKVRGDKRLDAIARQAHELILAHKPDRIIIEDQFVDYKGKSSRISRQAVVKLTEASAAWRFLEVPIEKVEGEVWQKHVGLKGNMSPEQRARILDGLVEGRLREYSRGLTLKNEHEKCAFLIGAWWIETKSGE